MPDTTLQSRPSLTPSQIADRRLAASNMTGPKRRAFEAEMTLQYCAGNPLMAEAVFGWGRQMVALGLAERRSGIICLGAQSAFSGRQRWEERHPQAAHVLRQLADAHAQPDPTFRTCWTYTRLTAHSALTLQRHLFLTLLCKLSTLLLSTLPLIRRQPMLPDCRTPDTTFAIPPFDVIPSDVEGFLEELWEFQATLHDGFARSEPRAHFFDSMVGQFRKLERKSIEPMALHVEGGTIRGMQRFLSDVRWDEVQMLWHDHQLVTDELGDPEGVLLFDETGFVKMGHDSVGVARQYCGTLGKGEHGPVGVFAGYASRQGYALVDKRLFLPEAWCGEAYAARRTPCHVPSEVTLQSKPQLAAALLQAIVREGLLPCKYIVADCLYGNSPDFLEAIDACVGITALVAISSATRCWRQRPQTEAKTYRDQQEERTKRVVVATAPAAATGAAVAASLPASCWYQRTVSEGTKGPITYALARQRVTLCKEGLPERTVWLVIKRTRGATPTYSYYLSHAPVSTPWRLLVWLSGVRWAIEQCFEESKTELGMEHDEMRQYPGWHHHMLTTMLAHFFLWHLKLCLGKKSPSVDGVAAPDLAGCGVTAADVHDWGCAGVGRMGAEA
jgi:SRSO17 transposase